MKNNPNLEEVQKEYYQKGYEQGQYDTERDDTEKLNIFMSLVRERTAIAAAISIHTFLKLEKENKDNYAINHSPMRSVKGQYGKK